MDLSLNTCTGALTSISLHLGDQGGIRPTFLFVMNLSNDVLF